MPRVGHIKTPLRCTIEAFLADTSETRDDWLDIPFNGNKRKKKAIYTMAYTMRKRGFPIDIIEADYDNNVVWIRRSDVTPQRIYVVIGSIEEKDCIHSVYRQYKVSNAEEAEDLAKKDGIDIDRILLLGFEVWRKKNNEV